MCPSAHPAGETVWSAAWSNSQRRRPRSRHAGLGAPSTARCRMLGHPRIWIVLAGAFTVANVAGAVMAAVALEPLHAATHLVLAFLSGAVTHAMYDVTRSDVEPTLGTPDGLPVALTASRLAHLELSLEGLAAGI